MKTKQHTILFFTLLFTIAFYFNATAQHCPFDGANTVVIRLTDENGAAINDAKNIKLVEKPNNHGKKLTEKTFLPTNDALLEFWSEATLKTYGEIACDDCKIFGDGLYAVVLNSEEAFYLLNDRYEKKDFEVQMLQNNGERRIVDVPKENLHSLCYHREKWSKIKPLEIFQRQNNYKNDS